MQKTHSITRIASAAVAAWRFVDASGAHATSAASAIGISEQAAEVGKAFSVVTNYSCWVEAAEAIGDGDLVRPASDGSGRAAKAASGDSCGRALGSAAAGKQVEVRFLEGAAESGGGISYATLASTPGTTPGERRTLSDGPDKGAQLVWSIPEGATAYAWCWQIYPLASYL